MMLQADNIAAYSDKTWDVGGGQANTVTVLEMARYLGLDYTFGPQRHGDAMVYIGENVVPGWTPEINWDTSETFRGIA